LQIIVRIAQQAVLQNKTVEAVEKLAVDFCITSKIYGGYPDVCRLVQSACCAITAMTSSPLIIGLWLHGAG